MSRDYSPFQQYSALCAAYDRTVSWGNLEPNGFTWYITVTPTPLSDTYTLKVTYRDGVTPKVFVIFPKHLPLAEGATKLPHVWDSKKQRLCLYDPRKRQWDKSKLIAHTVVHWAVEWLRYYETWAFTGKWHGGGEHCYDVVKDKD